MIIEKKLINYNRRLNYNNPKFIIIHETDNPSAGTDNHYKYWNSGEVSSSCHFIVDDTKAIQLAEYSTATWHSGKKYGKAPIPEANNFNSIGIEICVNKDFSKARSNAIEVVKKIMKELNISSNNVIRHYDACLKHCPRIMLDNPSMWLDFKNRLNSNMEDDDMIADTVKVAACKQNPIATSMINEIKILEKVVGLKEDGIATEELVKKLPELNGIESRGCVTVMQRILIRKGFLSYGSDTGVIGQSNKEAIKRFKDNVGIPDNTKLIDRQTWRKLLEY